MGTTADERLTEMLDQKDAEIDGLREKVDRLTRDVEQAEAGWTMHVQLPKEQALPVPRLELVWEPRGRGDMPWYTRIAKYRLVYRAFWDDVLAVPMGQTKVSGGRGTEPPIGSNGEIDMPFREGAHICHDMEVLKLPGFRICGDVVQDISHLSGKPDER